MIRARRRQHLGAVLALTLVIPVLLGIVLLGRPAVPPVADLDPRLRPAAGFPAPMQWQPQHLDSDRHRLLIQALRQPENAGITLVVRPEAVILQPDLLVYWTPDPPPTAVLSEAILVGSLSGSSRRLLQLPPAGADGAGSLLIYSLAHQVIIEQFALRDVQVMASLPPLPASTTGSTP